jgi:hypothetical protein
MISVGGADDAIRVLPSDGKYAGFLLLKFLRIPLYKEVHFLSTCCKDG